MCIRNQIPYPDHPTFLSSKYIITNELTVSTVENWNSKNNRLSCRKWSEPVSEPGSVFIRILSRMRILSRIRILSRFGSCLVFEFCLGFGSYILYPISKSGCRFARLLKSDSRTKCLTWNWFNFYLISGVFLILNLEKICRVILQLGVYETVEVLNVSGLSALKHNTKNNNKIPKRPS